MESIRRFATRKSRFLSSSRWKQTDCGLSIQQKGIAVDIQSLLSSYVIVMNGHQGRKSFISADEAKETVFEVIESGKAEAYLRKRAEGA
jgi:hypothetical protein